MSESWRDSFHAIQRFDKAVESLGENNLQIVTQETDYGSKKNFVRQD